MKPDGIRGRHALVVAVILLLLAVFVAGYVAREDCIYFWDSANYHGRYQELGSLVVSAPIQAFYQARHSIRHEDYNDLPILPLLPAHLLFGGGRLAFILAVFTILAVPAILSFLPLIRLTRLSRLLRSAQVVRSTQLFRLKGVGLKAFQAMVLVSGTKRFGKKYHERMLVKLKKQLKEMEEDLVELKEEIKRLEELKAKDENGT